MNLIICLDLKNGICFNNRRQSRDSKVIERICVITKDSKLILREYSKNLFSLPRSNIIVSTNPIGEAKSGDYCFIEQSEDFALVDNIERIIIYRWDKAYPQDECFSIDLTKWNLISNQIFNGTSHDKITEEVYIK